MERGAVKDIGDRRDEYNRHIEYGTQKRGGGGEFAGSENLRRYRHRRCDGEPSGIPGGELRHVEILHRSDAAYRGHRRANNEERDSP